MVVLPGIIAFDAYGTLFDVHAVGARLDRLWPGRGAELSDSLRRKQLEYSFLRALSGTWEPFRRVTADALRWSLAAAGVETEEDQVSQLMSTYDRVDAFPDAARALGRLHDAGVRCVILSNGSRDMLERAVEAAGIGRHLEAVLSADSVRTFKPDPAIYRLVEEETGVGRRETLMVSSNSWDVCGAAAFGLQTCWVRRDALPLDELGQEPTLVVGSLDELADHLLGS